MGSWAHPTPEPTAPRSGGDANVQPRVGRALRATGVSPTPLVAPSAEPVRGENNQGRPPPPALGTSMTSCAFVSGLPQASQIPPIPGAPQIVAARSYGS